MRFFSADLHLGHRNILKYTPRPWGTIEEMNEALVSNFNSVLGKRDELYIVGDFAFDRHGYWLNAIKGKKFLILGSHDKMHQDYYRCFSEVCLVKHIRMKNGRFCTMMHCCPRIWEKSHYGAYCLYAHSHGRLHTANLSADVGVDSREIPNMYFPTQEDQIIEMMEVREAEMFKAGRIVKEGNKILYRQDDVSYYRNQIYGTKESDCGIPDRNGILSAMPETDPEEAAD